MEPGGVFPRQRDGQTAAPGGLTDSATGSSYFIQWPWRPNNYERVPRTRTELCTHDTDDTELCRRANRMRADRAPVGLYRILRLCATDNYRRTICRSLFCEREWHESTDARPPLAAFPRSYWACIRKRTVSNLIDNLLGSHVEKLPRRTTRFRDRRTTGSSKFLLAVKKCSRRMRDKKLFF